MKLLSESALIGRERELGELQSFLDSAVAGHGISVLLQGEAGVGKTKLMREFLARVEKKNISVLKGWCLFNNTIPYFPFLEAFRSKVHSQRNRATTYLPKQANFDHILKGNEGSNEDCEVIKPYVWRDQAFIAIVDLLLAESVRKPIVVFIDDMHWADSASLSLFHYIAKLIGKTRILLIGAYRSEKLTARTDGCSNPLIETIRMMQREDLFKEMILPNLNKKSVGKLIHHMIGYSVDSELCEILSKKSSGNPLFIVESLRMLNEKGQLERQNRKWRIKIEDIGIPNKIRDLILTRLDVLKPNERKLLDVASIIGDRFNAKLLAEVTGEQLPKVLETLNEINHSTILICHIDNEHMFDHATSREVLYQEIPEQLKQHYHELVAEKMEADNAFSFNDLAYHYFLARNNKKLVKFGIAAGQDALLKFANAEAIKLFDRVLETISQDSVFTNEKKIALEGLGDALYVHCRFKDATAVFEKLATLETGVKKLGYYRKAMDSTFFQGDDPKHLTNLAVEAEKYLSLDRLEKARILVNIGRAHCFSLATLRDGLDDFCNALKIFEQVYAPPADIANVLIGIGATAAPFDGLQEKAVVATLRSIAMYETLDDIRGKIDALFFAAQTFFYLGFYKLSWHYFNQVNEIGKRIGDFSRLAQANAIMSIILEVEGNYKAAIKRNVKAAHYSKKTDIQWISAKIYSNFIRQYIACKDFNKASEYFDRLSNLPKDIMFNVNVSILCLGAKAIYLKSIGRKKEAELLFRACLPFSAKGTIFPYGRIIFDSYYDFLIKEGKVVELKKMQVQAELKRLKFKNAFNRAHLYAFISSRKDQVLGAEVSVNLILVNSSMEPFSITKIENLPKYLAKAKILDSFASLSVAKKIKPMSYKVIKATIKARETGVFTLNPEIVYMDKEGMVQKCQTAKKAIEVKSKPIVAEESKDTTKVIFKAQSTERVFLFLASAFSHDYLMKKCSMQSCGWRSLGQIIKKTNVSKYSVYGHGNLGPVVIELEHSGLIEARIFPGERGRAGKVLKVRVKYSNEQVKEQLGHKFIEIRGKMQDTNSLAIS